MEEKQEEVKNVHLMTAPSGVFNESNFWVYYDIVGHYHKLDKKIFIGEKNNCRYCGETDPKKFGSISHTCPEFTGNKKLFSLDECESCNSIFSKYETELGNHSHFMRTLMGLRGKNNTISFKSNNKKITFKNNGKKLLCQINNARSNDSIEGEDFIRKIDVKNNKQEFIFKFKNKRYIPLYLFKALNKFAFAILPKSELEKGGFEIFTEWLRNPERTITEDEPNRPFFYIYKNPNSFITKEPLLMIFKKREAHANAHFPTYSFFFAFGRFAYQIFLPFYKHDEIFLYAKELYLPIIPELLSKKGEKGKFVWMNGFSLEKTELEDFRFILNS